MACSQCRRCARTALLLGALVALLVAAPRRVGAHGAATGARPPDGPRGRGLGRPGRRSGLGRHPLRAPRADRSHARLGREALHDVDGAACASGATRTLRHDGAAPRPSPTSVGVLHGNLYLVGGGDPSSARRRRPQPRRPGQPGRASSGSPAASSATRAASTRCAASPRPTTRGRPTSSRSRRLTYTRNGHPLRLRPAPRRPRRRRADRGARAAQDPGRQGARGAGTTPDGAPAWPWSTRRRWPSSWP